MRRKTGEPKLRARRNAPYYEHGFKNNPNISYQRHPQLTNDKINPQNITAVSLFAGCGGFDLGILGGFSYLGEYFPVNPIQIVKAYDFEQKAVDTYKLNISNDIETTDLSTVNISTLPSADLLLGGFPCQDFSTSGLGAGLAGHRGRLYLVMVEYLRHHKPKMFIAENVTQLARMRKGEILQTILDDFRLEGYNVTTWNINCPEYGLAQNRERLFIVGTRTDQKLIGKPDQGKYKWKYRTIYEAIGDLQGITTEYIANQSQYYIAIPASVGGGQGDEINQRDSIAYCIRANPRGRVHFHYDLPRRLTVRECARLQSFPDEFVFPYMTQNNMQLIGNAVPPIIGHLIGKCITRYFDDPDESNAIDNLSDVHIKQLNLF